uniref:TGF-beta family profile domain-containing protein n=1 Tax=Periophthalmus magnuspinnatus TaxID=409849 RepID=A0A3B3ZCE1_9GOBI
MLSISRPHWGTQDKNSGSQAQTNITTASLFLPDRLESRIPSIFDRRLRPATAPGSMSFTCIFMMTLLGSAVVIAFVLQPSQEESDRFVIAAGFHQSCQSVSLQSIKKELLKSLNLQAEPQVPVGLLDSVQEQWKQAFSALSSDAIGSEVQEEPSNSLKCCSLTSEIFMKDLGWSNWVIYPSSLTVTKCKLCIREGNTVQCPAPVHPQNGQVPCCRPTSHKLVPIVYMSEYGSVVISSVQLAQGCDCDIGNNQEPINK